MIVFVLLLTCRWHISEWTMLRQASADVGALVVILVVAVVVVVIQKVKNYFFLHVLPLSIMVDSKAQQRSTKLCNHK